MRDQHQPARVAGDQVLQRGQPVGVQVVGRLVEQQHVRPDQQHRGQPEPGRLAAGQRRRAAVEHVGGQREPVGHRHRPLGQVGAAEREPRLQGGRVPVVGAAPARGQRGGRPVQLGLGRGHPGPPGQVAAERLARPHPRLLRHVHHRGGRRVPDRRCPPPARARRPARGAGWSCRPRWAPARPPGRRARPRGRCRAGRSPHRARRRPRGPAASRTWVESRWRDRPAAFRHGELDRLPWALRSHAPSPHDLVTNPTELSVPPPTVADVTTTMEATRPGSVRTAAQPPAPPPRPRSSAPRRRSGGGTILLPPWTRAPLLPFRQPAVILAVVGAAAILACASASAALFLSSASSESLRRIVAVGVRGRGRRDRAGRGGRGRGGRRAARPAAPARHRPPVQSDEQARGRPGRPGPAGDDRCRAGRPVPGAGERPDRRRCRSASRTSCPGCSTGTARCSQVTPVGRSIGGQRRVAAVGPGHPARRAGRRPGHDAATAASPASGWSGSTATSSTSRPARSGARTTRSSATRATAATRCRRRWC